MLLDLYPTAITAAPLFRVALCDYPDLSDEQRTRAETRYARTLERQLGGQEAVCQHLSLLQHLEDAPPEDITEDAKAAYHRWAKAVRAAAEVGMQGLGAEDGCFFEVLLEKEQ